MKIPRNFSASSRAKGQTIPTRLYLGESRGKDSLQGRLRAACWRGGHSLGSLARRRDSRGGAGPVRARRQLPCNWERAWDCSSLGGVFAAPRVLLAAGAGREAAGGAGMGPTHVFEFLVGDGGGLWPCCSHLVKAVWLTQRCDFFLSFPLVADITFIFHVFGCAWLSLCLFLSIWSQEVE